MLFKNKLTGVIWDIVDETHIKRCSNDSNYEKVTKPKKEVEQEQPKKEAPKKKASTAKKKSTSKK